MVTQVDMSTHKSWTYSQDMYRIHKSHFLRIVDTRPCSFLCHPRLACCARYLTGEDNMAGGEATEGK